MEGMDNLFFILIVMVERIFFSVVLLIFVAAVDISLFCRILDFNFFWWIPPLC